MSYSGLGAEVRLSSGLLTQQPGGSGLVAQTAISASAPAPRPPATDPFFPPSCAHLKRYRLPPSTIQADTIVVKAWPFTKASATQVNAMLDYLTKPVRGRDEVRQARNLRAFPAVINQAWMRGLNYSGGSPTSARLLRVFSAGWIPDTESNQSVTRGTFWIAFSLGAPRSRGWYDQQMRAFKRQAMQAAGIISPTLQNTLMPNVSGLAMAEGGYNVTSEQLREGAYKSALSSGEFGAFIRTTFTMPRIAKTSSQIAQPIEARAKKVRDAMSAVNQVGNIASGVGAVIGQAHANPDVAAGVQMLVATRREVENVKAMIVAGVEAVPGVIADGQRIESDILRQMRSQILAAAEASIRRGIGFSIARDYVRCWTLQQARRSLGRQIDSLLGILAAGIAAAQQLKANMGLVRQRLGELQEIIERLKKEERELPLSPWQRTTMGLPNWSWAALGAVAFVGGAFGLRRLRKKKPKKNRRSRRLRA